MMHDLPDFLLPYRKQAEQLLAQSLVRDVEFSGETYQIQVIDPKTKKEVWTFIQLDAQGNIKDCFCSCEDESEEPEDHAYCAHLAAAFLRIYNKEKLPLHQRFQKSLWNQLCQLFESSLGDDPETLKKISQGHFKLSDDGAIRFYIKAKTPSAKSHLIKILEERRKETESSSLKFSNLSDEDIALWQAGTPSAELKYQLSFWNDLAHWFMLMQDSKIPYSIQFEGTKKELPSAISIAFDDVEAGFHLTDKEWLHVIPALATVDSPLKVHEADPAEVGQITYNKKTDTLFIEPKREGASGLRAEQGITLDGWVYVPGDGFYAKGMHPLIALAKVSGQNIAEVLNQYTSLIRDRIEKCPIHPKPIKLQYSLAFDEEWNLHIKAYAFTPGDLSTPFSHYYENWIYLEDQGFYPLSKSHFDALETVISSEEINDFVYRERDWLNHIEGFHTHLSSVESQITYELSSDNKLSFTKQISSKKMTSVSKDFGVWVYIKDQGFYPKGTTYTALPVAPETTIHANHIPFFIRINRAELQMVPGFFCKKCPVAKAGLQISLNKSQGIDIVPKFELQHGYQEKDVRYFEEFVYVEGEGFYELPASMRLPEEIRHTDHIESKNVPSFLITDLEKLLPYATDIDHRLLPPSHIDLIAYRIEKASEEEGEWYKLTLNYKTGRGQIPATAIWTAIKQKKKFLFDEAGRIDVQELRFEWLRRLPKNRIDKTKNTILLTTLELIRLHALETITMDSKAPDIEVSTALLRELTEFHLPENPDLTGMRGTLRPYQQVGMKWLWFLYQHNLSGLLCDEMGLGKTHQAMALLTGIVNAHRSEQWRRSPHFLVVCPTSVMFHWKEKLEEYFPGLRICTFYGSDRNLTEFHEQYDLLLTSYGIWRLEHEILSKIPFEVAIFDEIQVAKNQNSRIHAALLTVNAKIRLGLTGTPIENYLRELKALFDLVLPGYMPNDKDYRELFVKPIERDSSEPRRNLLKRFVNPFMMRRKKIDVLPDLPEKTEEISHCELSPDQEVLYTQVLHQSRRYLLEQLHDPKAPVPYMHIFALLANLKQICNHPAVYLKKPADYLEYNSGKWDLFVELLTEARESQQKVVVFSQYLAMLDILENYLNDQGIEFAEIRGATLNRGQQVQRFNQDPKCEVFLGSLQAAGLGVDLTGGSVVIHYDRWWNAAREDQATDRVHRIGQTRGVQVFKLVTKGTFEERIDTIISRKARLMEEVVTADDARFMKAFDRNELIQLLQDIEEIKTAAPQKPGQS